MKNLIFISPNFPSNYWHFCREVKNNGMNVLGIGDQPYDELTDEQRGSMTEYYKVGTLMDYDQVYRAVAFFAFKYGRIDYLESNNEFWLEQDARLRDDFNIKSGFHSADMPRIRYKSGMKEYYRRAGIPTARWHMVDDFDSCRAFIDEVGYPVIVKPDNGVGANDTWKLCTDTQLNDFLARWDEHTPYIMEEFIDAEVNSYDAIYNAEGEPIFETGNVTPDSIMDIVNNDGNSVYYIRKHLPDDILNAGRATAKAFGVKSRFIHFEFFRLKSDQYIGKTGDLVALEVNMRPSGGFSPDMMNFAHSTDVYKIWADMMAYDKTDMPLGSHAYCAFVGRRDGKHFVMDHDSLMEKYGENMCLVTRIPKALSPAMGDMAYMAAFFSRREMDAFYSDALAEESVIEVDAAPAD